MHKILNIAVPSPQEQKNLVKELGISELVAQLLINRGMRTPQEADRFLNASLRDLLDPFSFREMPLAVNYIKKAIKQKHRIMVFGDYDVDGVTSLALLQETLTGLGAEVVHYIPHRVKEGYGLSTHILSLAKEQGVRLLITADCGTNSTRQITQLRQHGIEVIVTDHHEPAENAGAAYASAMINPKFKDSGYGFRDLAGVGVAYKLCQALTALPLETDLDLVSLGTIADSVPLIGENRIFAKKGLTQIRRTGRLGLKTLIEESGIKGKEISPEFVSFILGPRLNASGRLDTAETALELLLTQDHSEAEKLAKTVEGFNRQRQKIESRIMEEAQELVNQEVNFKEHNVMVVAKEGWHLGVLGIVASKLADRFYRPAILISLEKGLCRGSGRSIKNFHLFNGLTECSHLLDTFGGHSHAVGMVIPQGNIEEFKRHINQFAKSVLNFNDLIPSLDIDMEIGLPALDTGFLEAMQALEPFGQGNPEPLFLTRSLSLKGVPRLYSRDTLKFWVSDGNLTYPAIGFGMGALYESVVNAKAFDLVYKPRIDTWQGQDSLVLEIEEVFFK